MRDLLRRLPWPRVRVRTMLLLIALVAVAIGAWLAWQREHEAFLRREHYRALVAHFEDVIANLDDMANGEEYMAQKSQESARRWREGHVPGGSSEEHNRAEARRIDGQAAEFARMAAVRRKTAAAVRQLLPEIRRAAERRARGDDPEAEAELRRLLEQLP